MDLYFGNRYCEHCGKAYDRKISVCPYCKEGNPDRRTHAFDQQIHLPWYKELVFFLLGIVGLALIVNLIAIVEMPLYAAAHPELSGSELSASFSAYMDSGQGLFSLYSWAYPILFLIVCLLFWKSWKQIAKSFASWKGLLMGVAVFVAIFAFEMAYNQIASLILNSAGVTPSVNENQNNLNSMIVLYPVSSLIIFGILGPFVEEAAYRVGLFGLSTRLGKVTAYILTIIVFSLIHFDFGCFGSSESMIIEFVNLPVYMFSGFAFSFAYDKFGLGCSYTAHMINNVFSVLINYIQLANK